MATKDSVPTNPPSLRCFFDGHGNFGMRLLGQLGKGRSRGTKCCFLIAAHRPPFLFLASRTRSLSARKQAQREDRTLLVGDAFCTAKPESFFEAALIQQPELHGPPSYFTQDWEQAR